MLISAGISSDVTAVAAHAPPCPPHYSHEQAHGVANAVVPIRMRSWREGRSCPLGKKIHANPARCSDYQLGCSRYFVSYLSLWKSQAEAPAMPALPRSCWMEEDRLPAHPLIQEGNRMHSTSARCVWRRTLRESFDTRHFQNRPSFGCFSRDCFGQDGDDFQIAGRACHELKSHFCGMHSAAAGRSGDVIALAACHA